MTHRLSDTLRNSLKAVFERPSEHVADVRFTFPEGQHELFAHRALLKVRVPEPFRQKYFPQLDCSLTTAPLVCIPDIDSTLPYSILKSLLRFWYTAEFGPGPSSADDGTNAVRHEVTKLEKKLGMELLPTPVDGSDDDKLVEDLRHLLEQKINADVVLDINPKSREFSIETFSAHRFILAARSSYFQAMFCQPFSEASNPIVSLPSDIFSGSTLQVIIYYLYTGLIKVPFTIPTVQKEELTKKKHMLRVLQRAFRAAEYLCHEEGFCGAALGEMTAICHQFKCPCNDCVILLPSMLSFADRNVPFCSEARKALIDLYASKNSLQRLWVQKPFAILIESISTASSEQSFVHDGSDGTTGSTLINDLNDAIYANLKKHNAVHFLHDVYLSLSRIQPLESPHTFRLISEMLHRTVSIVSNNFSYYCVEYPTLLSCIDRIGCEFTIDFLQFVLDHVLDEGICDENAGMIYQSIVRDMLARQKIVNHPALDSLLDDKRRRCAQYISNRWAQVKACGVYEKLDKETLSMLADDINIPQRSFTKPSQHDLSSVFGFRSILSWKSRNKQKKNEDGNDNNAKLKRHLSLRSLRSFSGGMMKRTMSWSSTEYHLNLKRTQSLSSDPTPFLSDTLVTEDSSKPPSPSMSQQQHQSKKAHHSTAPVDQGSALSLTDALLPIDIPIAPAHAGSSQTPEKPAARPTRLKFELPVTPKRTTSYPAGNVSRRSRNKNRFRWSIGSSPPPTPVLVGDKVELLYRPLPTHGTVKFIGALKYKQGTWVGVELQHRLGNCDGTSDGIRYFETESQRGVFVLPESLKVLSTSKTPQL